MPSNQDCEYSETNDEANVLKSPSTTPGWIVQSRTCIERKSISQKWVEFCVVCEWVVGFLTLGFACMGLFAYLSYGTVRHVMTWISINFTASDQTLLPDEGKNKYILETIYFTITIPFIALYSYYWQRNSDSPERGTPPRRWLRRLGVWKRLADYFPINLVLSEELFQWNKKVANEASCENNGIDKLPQSSATLPNNQNYLVGYHPHGVFSTGAFVNFMTGATGFDEAFPGLTPHLAVLKAHFKAPFYRDYLLALGIVAATKKGLRYLLEPDSCGRTGNFVVVVVGGAPEALEATPGEYRMVISRRFGFFKLALQTGTSLIPCVSFGEQDMYKQVANYPGSWVRKFQEWMTRVSSFAPPFFYARGPFPYRTPVNTVVGAPIDCEIIAEPSMEQIAELKAKYMDGLRKLFERYRRVYDPAAHDILFL